MLVQLRRVVYLLVLLQCCLGVCLANAKIGALGAKPDLSKLHEIEIKLDGLRRRADGHSDLLRDQPLLKDAVNRSSYAISAAWLAVNRTKDFDPRAEAGDESKTREPLREAQRAVAEAEAEVRNMNRLYGDAVDQAKEGAMIKIELETALKKYAGVSGGDEESHPASKSLKNLRQSLVEINKIIKEKKPEKEKIDAALESLRKSLKPIEGSQKPPLPGNPETRGQQDVGGTKEVVKPGQHPPRGGANPPKAPEGLKENTQSGNTEVNTTMTNNGNAGGQQSDGERVGNNQSASQDDVTPKEPKGNESTKTPGNTIPNKQNETHNHENEEQNERGKPNETRDSQKPNETSTAAPGSATGDSQKPKAPSNAPSGTVNTGSGGVTSGSHSSSSGSIHLNVSGLSDSSVSPALVHSPLLLLLFCVLGSILVF